jgi:hypothetical protein
MNKYQFFAERKKEPPSISWIITGNMMLVIGRQENKVAFGAQEVPDGWWANQCRSKS